MLSNTSQISMQLQKLTLANDLSLLPAPFYDSKDMQALTLPSCSRRGRRQRTLASGRYRVLVRHSRLLQGR